MHIEIENTQTIDRSVTSGKTGQVFYIRTQNALLFKDGSKHPYHFQLRLAFEDDVKKRDAVGPVSPGQYDVIDDAYTVDRFGDVEFSITPKFLVPREAAKPATLFPGKTGTSG
jgi:hypothetical protein